MNVTPSLPLKSSLPEDKAPPTPKAMKMQLDGSVGETCPRMWEQGGGMEA